MPLTRTIAIAGLLVLLGAGCAPGTPAAEPGTRADMPKGIPMMEGLEPKDEASWRIVTLGDARRLESRWTTAALFDQVQAWYVDAFGDQGLATHTIETEEEVRIFWGLADRIRLSGQGSEQDIVVKKARVDGRTVVEMNLDLR